MIPLGPDPPIHENAGPPRKQREKARLDTEVARLKNRLAVLANEQKLLIEAIETHDPPINTLSPEVLQEIFVLCLPVAHNAVMSAREAPLLLCRVCHGWRQLALATPRLWTSIHISLCDIVGAVPMPSPGDINAWLSRSKSLPVSISFLCFPAVHCSGVTMYQHYLDSITSVASRWKSLHVSSSQPDVFKYILSDDVEAKSMEELSVVSGSLPNLDEWARADSDLKQLLPFTLHSLSLPFDAHTLSRLTTDYQNLTHLGITYPGDGIYELSDSFDILLSAPLLRSLSLCGFHSSIPIESIALPHCTVHLAHLEALSITNFEPYSHAMELLRALHAPLLRHLRYFLIPPHDNFPIKTHLNAIAVFLRRLKEPLEEFDLHLHSHGTEFRRLLALLPGLKRLSLEQPHTYSPFADKGTKNIGDFHLNRLIEDPHIIWEESRSVYGSHTDEDEDYEPLPEPISNLCCPQLEVIKCVCNGQSLSKGVLLNFLRLRTGSRAKAAGITPLRKVAIITELPISEAFQEEVNEILDGTGTSFHLFSTS